jgi:hypothetical protein
MATSPAHIRCAGSAKPARLAFVAFVVLAALPGGASAATVTETFDFTGAAQTWTVPAGVDEATFDVYGAQGGSYSPTGGLGGRATATIAVTPGDSIQLRVGGEGGIGVGAAGGFNGGGAGPVPVNGYSGGGASDVRIGGAALTDRVLVAGGGGGAGNVGTVPSGGAGGGLAGSDGEEQGFPSNVPGGGGTQVAGGTAGGSNATPGVFGSGGDGGWSGSPAVFGPGGGGGGGWFGGGGGYGAGGGGGSGHGPLGTAFETGVRSGDGLITIEYEQQPPFDPPPVITDLEVVPKRFAASEKPTASSRKAPAQIELTLSEDAAVTFKVRRDPPPSRGGPPPKHPRRFKAELVEGQNSVPFTGRIGDLKLKPGRYRLKAKAWDSIQQRSEPVSTVFRVTASR